LFTKLRKETITFAMFVCLSVRQLFCMKQLGYHWTEFREILYSSAF